MRAPRRMRKSRVALLLSVLLLLAAGGRRAGRAFVKYRKPLPLPGSPFDFDVRSGAPLATVARTLRDAGVLIPHPAALTLLARVRGVDRTIKAGSYEIEQRHHAARVAREADARRRHADRGDDRRGRDVRRLAAGRCATAPMSATTRADLPDAELLARARRRRGHPEGLLFPGHVFPREGQQRSRAAEARLSALHERLDAAWARRAPDLPLATPYEALILASIVEKETGHPNDRPLIASVFVNRLKRGMRLQTDPTVIYGMGARFDGNLRKRDLETDSPYNTYMRDGLAADADRVAVAGVDRRRDESAADGRTSISYRAATARRSSRRTCPITIAPCQNIRRAGA